MSKKRSLALSLQKDGFGRILNYLGHLTSFKKLLFFHLDVEFSSLSSDYSRFFACLLMITCCNLLFHKFALAKAMQRFRIVNVPRFAPISHEFNASLT